MKKRWISLLLVLSMLLSMLPIQIFAVDMAAEQVESAENEISTVNGASVLDSGYCGGEGDGSHLTWTLYESGMLTIAGTGPMADMNTDLWDAGGDWGDIIFPMSLQSAEAAEKPAVQTIDQPWYDYNRRVESVLICKGVTSIGENAFEGCDELANVVFADTVTRIGYDAFYSCEKLETVYVPASVTYIDHYAFHECKDVWFKGDAPEVPENFFFGYGPATVHYLPYTSGWTDSDLYDEEKGTWCKSPLVPWDLPEQVLEYLDRFGMAPENVCSYDADTFETIEEFAVVDDIDAYHGRAVFCNSDELTNPNIIHIGQAVSVNLQNRTGGTISLGSISLKEQKENLNTGYAWYRLEDIVLSEAMVEGGLYVHMFNWRVQNKELCADLADKSGHTVDLYISMKIEGNLDWSRPYPAYSIDRMILVDKTPNDAEAKIDDVYYGTLIAAVEDAEENAVIDLLFGVEKPIEISKALTINRNGMTINDLTVGEGYTLTETEEAYVISDANAAPTSGSCGTDMTWTFDEQTGTLTISGSGMMDVFDVYEDVNTVPWADFCDLITKIVVEEGVESVSGNAFADMEQLETVALPSTLREIGWNVFRNSGLTEIEFPAGMQSMSDYVFYNCKNLRSVTMPENLYEIPYQTFYGCAALEEVVLPEAADYIGYEAFYGCESLQSITIPASVTGISSRAFYGCTNLQTVYFKGNAPYVENTSFPETTVLYYTPGTTGWTDSDAYDAAAGTWNGYQLEEKPYVYSSGYCGGEGDGTNLRWEVDENGLLTITGNGPMADMYTPDGPADMALFSAAEASVISMERPWYDYYDIVKTVVIGNGVTTIGENAFENCYNLTDLTIGKKVETIGENAFSSCYGLKEVTIPDSVTTIGEYAFTSCGVTDLTIGSGVKVISNSAFCYCSDLTAVTIPDSVTTIDDWAFRVCGLKEVTIPDSVMTLGTAFYDCQELETVIIGSGVTALDEDTFAWCQELTSVYFTGNAPVVESGAFDAKNVTLYYTPGTTGWTDSDAYDAAARTWNGYKLRAWGEEPEETISGYCGGEGDGTNLIWELDENGVLTISGTGAMADYENTAAPWKAYADTVQSIVIGDGVTYIGIAAFNGCKSVTDLTIGKGVTLIRRMAFNGCTGLTELIIPSNVTNIGGMVFFGCTGLTDIYFEGDAPAVGTLAFPTAATAFFPKGAYGWTEPKWNGITSQSYEMADGTRFFSGVGGSVRYNGNTGVIEGASAGLTHVIIPADLGIAAINGGAFTGCTNLQEVVLPHLAIADDSFAPSVTLYGPEDSAAQSYAEEYGLEFVPIAVELRVETDGTVLTLTAEMNTYEALPLTFTCDAAGLEVETEVDGSSRIFRMDLAEAGEKIYHFTIENSEYGISETYDYTWDTKPPRIATVSPDNGTMVQGVMTLTVTAEDDVALKSIKAEISPDKQSWTEIDTVETGKKAVFTYDTTQWTKQWLYIRLTAADAAGNTAEGSTIYRYEVDNTAPAAITGLKVVQALSTVITLGWDDVPDADFYCFKVEQQMDGQWVLIRQVDDALGVNLMGLTPNTTYTYRISACDKVGNRGEAAEITVITAADTTKPVIASMQPSSGWYRTEIPLTFRLSDDHGIQSLLVQLSADGGKTWEEVQTIATNSLQVTYTLDVREMEEGTIRVRGIAVDKSGNRSDETEAAPFVEYMVDRTAPAAPKNVTAVSGSGYIEINWEKAEETDSATYSVYRSESAEGPYACIRTGLRNLGLQDTSVAYGKTYYYYVTLCDRAGNVSEQSDVVECYSNDDEQAPEILSISPQTGSAVGVTAAARVKAVDNYSLAKLYYRWSANGKTWSEEQVISVSGRENLVNLPLDLKEFSGKDVELQVRCEDLVGLQSEVTSVQFHVDGQAPAVTELTAVLEDTGVQLSWQPSPEEDVSGYILYRKEGSGSYRQLMTRSVSTKVYTYLDNAVTAPNTYTYYLQVIDRYGNYADSEPTEVIEVAEDWIGNQDHTNPVADISCSSVGTEGVSMQFDAGRSWDDRQIVAYVWDFGDGEGASEEAVSHTYTQTGTYVVSLEVYDKAGNSHKTSTTVEIRKPVVMGTVTVCVTDENGHPVSGAGVYLDLGGSDMSVKLTNSLGEVTLQAPAGVHTIGAYKDGYLPAKGDTELFADTTTRLTLTIVEDEIVTGELTTHRMTLEEIRAAGIDVSDPANQEVFQFTIQLTYGTTVKEVDIISGGDSNPEPEVVEINDKVIIVVIPDPGPTPKPGGGGGGSTPGPGPFWPSIEQDPPVVLLEIPGKATWLKDFFEVKLTVLNNADADFYLDDCTADLIVPSGLTLMDSNYTSASSRVSMGTIQGKTSGTAYWIVRGDKKGSYDLAADFSANLRDFDERIEARFETKDPIVVRQNAGLSMELEVENTILPNTDGALRVGLRNEDPDPYYLPNIGLDPNLVCLTKTYKTVGTSLMAQENADLEVLDSGETVWFEYLVPRESWDMLTKRSEDEFYLHDALVAATGGTTTLPVHVSDVSPLTFSADKLEVFRLTDSGDEVPIELINAKREVAGTHIPTMIVRTYALQPDGTYAPCDMDVTVKDDFQKDAEVEKVDGETGVYRYNGYWTQMLFDNNKSGSITFTAARTVSDIGGGKEWKMSRCKPVSIPVAMRSFTTDKGTADFVVYESAGGAIGNAEGVKIFFKDYSQYDGVTNEAGEYRAAPIILGYHEVTVEKAGYRTITDVIKVSDGSKFYYTLMEDVDAGKSRVLSVDNYLSADTNSNVTVIPEGHMTGNLTLIPKFELQEGDVFAGFRYRKVRGGKVVETEDFTAQNGYTIAMNTLQAGDQIYFALLYQNSMGTLCCSRFTDSLVVVTDAPGVFEEFMFSLQDVQNKSKKDTGLKVSLDPTKLISDFKFTDLMEQLGEKPKGSDNDQKTYEAVGDVINGYQFERGKSEFMFPLNVTYDVSGKLTFSVIFGASGKHRLSKVTEDGATGVLMSVKKEKPLGVSTSESFTLDFIIQYNPSTTNWELTVNGTLSAEQSLTLVKATFVKNLVYVNAKGTLTEKIGWTLVDTDTVFDPDNFDPSAVICADVDLEKLFLSFGLRAAGGLQLFSDDWASAGVFVSGDVGFNFVPYLGAEAKFKAGTEYKVLFWGGDQPWFERTFEVAMAYPGKTSLMSAMDVGSESLTVTAMPKGFMQLQNSDPNVFAGDVFYDVHARLTTLPDGRVMMVWLDYTGDSSNPVTVCASVYENGLWSQTVRLDEDGTPDLMTGIAVTENGAVAVWNDLTTDISGIQQTDSETLAAQMPQLMGVSAAFYDGTSWSEPVSLHTGAAASEPVAVTYGSRTLVAWVANDTNLYHSEAAPEYIRWVLLEDGIKTEEGTLSGDGCDLSTLRLGSSYGRFELAVLKQTGETMKLYTADFTGDGWGEWTRANNTEGDDTALAYDAEGTLYYVNNGRILRKNGGSQIQLFRDELLNSNVTALNAVLTDAGTVLTWTAASGEGQAVCSVTVDANDRASEPAVLMENETGPLNDVSAAAAGSGLLISAREAIVQEDTWVSNLLTKSYSFLPDISISKELVEHSGTVYPGGEVATSVSPVNHGLVRTGGLRVTIATDAFGGDVVASADFADRTAATLHWQVPETYAGAPLYVVVTPLSGQDPTMGNNAVALNNVVQEIAVGEPQYLGQIEGKHTFALSVYHDGLTDAENLDVELTLLGNKENRVLAASRVDYLAAGTTQSVLLTCDELDLSRDLHLMASAEMLSTETDTTDNRSYLTLYATEDASESVVVTDLRWTDTFDGTQDVGLTVELENMGDTERTIRVMAACYDGSGKLLHTELDEAVTAASGSGLAEAVLPAEKLKDAQIIRAFVLDEGFAPLCESGKLERE